MNVTLGINSVYHETAAAIVIDGRLVAAAEEERFSRRKHGKEARVDNPHELGTKSIEYCLRAAGVKVEDISAIGFSFDPAVRNSEFKFDPLSQNGNWGDPEGESRFRAGLEAVPETLSKFLGRDIENCFRWIPHHVAHAASAYYPSGWNESAILVIDGIGEHASTLLAKGVQETISPLEQISYPHSLGFLWEKLSAFLGFSEYDACKVMGLAAYGNPELEAGAFAKFLTIHDDGFAIDPEILQFRLNNFEKLEAFLGPRRLSSTDISPRYANIAATLQKCTNDAMLALVRRLARQCPSSRLCMAGGVALNCTSNWLIKEEGPFSEIFIAPTPHDAGTAIGAALYLSRNSISGGCLSCLQSPYLGPSFASDQIERAIQKKGLVARKVNDPCGETARRISEGAIVGWFQGAMEFGPRALGNRSLLADPRKAESRARMNRSVKRRESFRPFAPSVLAERCCEWFSIGKPSEAYHYMLYACPAHSDKAHMIPAVLHTDGTARIQIVDQKSNARFHSLISNFYQLTNVPMILNTSFNDSEPIVCTPEDAISTFLNSDIDLLVIDDYMLEKTHSVV